MGIRSHFVLKMKYQISMTNFVIMIPKNRQPRLPNSNIFKKRILLFLNQVTYLFFLILTRTGTIKAIITPCPVDVMFQDTCIYNKHFFIHTNTNYFYIYTRI